jgi:uncharacterized protein YndB with AHSA1/START domain
MEKKYNQKNMAEKITVSVLVNAPVATVWECWTNPGHITEWCFASDDWCAPHATNDVRVGGTFTTRMEAVDKSGGFDFGGTYTEVATEQHMTYVMNGEDAREVTVTFAPTEDGGCLVTETFDAETLNPLEMQRAGWQAILENFKIHVEKH